MIFLTANDMEIDVVAGLKAVLPTILPAVFTGDPAGARGGGSARPGGRKP